jgi:hypothetical protein
MIVCGDDALAERLAADGGLLLRAVERTPPGHGRIAAPGLCTLAVLSSTTNDPAGSEGSDASGREAPILLPDDDTVTAATGRGTVVLETVTHTASRIAQRRLARRGLPLGSLFSRRLRWSLAGLLGCVLGMAVATWLTTDEHPLHAAYLTLLDLFAIGDPALDEPTARQVLQLLAGLAGLLLLPGACPRTTRSSGAGGCRGWSGPSPAA